MAKPQYDHLIKILMIGDSGVGKTSFVHRYFDNAFSTSFIPTIGVDFRISTIMIKDKKIRLQIWDSAGQERFNAITSSYYRGAHGVMLLYDVTDANSFQNVSKWLRNIDEYAQEEVSILLVGNKVDSFDNISIRTEQGKELAKKHNIDFIETSAKQNVNIKEAVNFFVTKIVEKKMNKQMADLEKNEKQSENVKINALNSNLLHKTICC